MWYNSRKAAIIRLICRAMRIPRKSSRHYTGFCLCAHCTWGGIAAKLLEIEFSINGAAVAYCRACSGV